jgi:hypothetical protein
MILFVSERKMCLLIFILGVPGCDAKFQVGYSFLKLQSSRAESLKYNLIALHL